MSRRGQSREGDIYAEEVRVSIYSRCHASFPQDKHRHPSAVVCEACVQKQGLARCARAGSGEGQRLEGGMKQSIQYVSYTPQDRHLRVACAPLQSLEAAEVHDRG